MSNSTVINDAKHPREQAFDLVCRFYELAMVYREVVHIFVDYQAHVDVLAVRATLADTDYQSRGYEYLIKETIYHVNDGKLNELISIKERLQNVVENAQYGPVVNDKPFDLEAFQDAADADFMRFNDGDRDYSEE